MSKNDLLRIIEEQKVKIDRYEKKLKDVIQAYKSLSAEKAALEQSLKALASGETEENVDDLNKSDSSRSQPGSCVQLTISSSERSLDLLDTSENKPDDRESVASSEDTEDSSTLRVSSERNQAKIVTLKRALATISAEKSRQEVAFTEDRKRLINEQETLQCQLTKMEEEAEMAKITFEQQINDLRATIRQMQCERECEHSDHGAMLKELQQKLAHERAHNEQLQKQMHSLSSELKTKEQQPLELLEQISVLNNEISKLKENLGNAEAKIKEMPNLLKLQNELAQTKAQHQLALDKQQSSARDLQDEMIKLRNQNEERIGTLENKISELVVNVGDYERKKFEDEGVIENLKLKIRQLENENHILRTNGVASKIDYESYEGMISKCREIIQKLKSFQGGAKESPQNILSAVGFSDEDDFHQHCRKEFEQLKDEYDKYKIRAQALLKSKSVPKDFQNDSEVENLRQLVINLQQKLQETKELHNETERKYQTDLEDLRRTVNTLKENHSRELLEAEQKCQRRIVSIESESLKQRERTLDVLVEKEKEISAMRAILSATRNTPPYAAAAVKTRSESRSSFHSVDGASASDSENVRRPGEVDIFATPADPAPTNLYYTQEMARKEKEIAQLKRDLHRTESQLIEIQHSVVTKELIHFEIAEKLKDEIRNLETKLARFSDVSNLEYLKNVFVQFALCNDTTCKQHMLKAIAVALKLSAKETDVLLKHYVKNAWFVKSAK